jgi:hypothetical protein
MRIATRNILSMSRSRSWFGSGHKSGFRYPSASKSWNFAGGWSFSIQTSMMRSWSFFPPR